MTEQHRELKSALRDSIAALEKKHEALETTVTNLRMELVRLLGGFAVAMTIITLAAPYVLKAVLGG